MLAIGDIHIFVNDFNLALRFYCDGLELQPVEQHVSSGSSYALLEFPSGGPAIRLFGGADPWPEGERPDVGSRPTVRFDIVSADFDATLVRLMEHGGRQVGEIETYGSSRVVTIADPDGNTFELLEVPEDADEE